MAQPTREEWQTISTKLKEPFSPDSVSWRVQGKNEGGKAQVCAYLDSRDVMDRLDAVVGAENWSFDWQPVVTSEAKGLLVAKGTLTIFGVSKSDVGDASTFEGTKGTVSDTLKRCAVHWGIGRYLYELPSVWVQMQGSKIADFEKPRLRALLTGEKLPEPTQAQTSKPAQKPQAAKAPAQPQKPTPIKPAQEQEPPNVVDLKARATSLGIVGNAWKTCVCLATKKSEEEAAKGLTPEDRWLVKARLDMVEEKGKPIAS